CVILDTLSEGKGYIVHLLHSFFSSVDLQVINSMLDQTKNWITIEESSFSVCTFLKMNEKFADKMIIIFDEPCAEITKEQILKFTDLEDQDWFQVLTPHQKKLAVYYRERIIFANVVIPSQLRGIIPLCMNSYQQTISIASANEIEIVNSYYHCAAAAYINHKGLAISQAVTRHNLLQQKHISKTNSTVMICLNSRYGDNFLKAYEWFNNRDYNGDDSEIVKLTMEAASNLSDDKIYYSKICLNNFRMLEYNDYSGINNIIHIVQSNIKKIKDNSLCSDSHLDKLRVLSDIVLDLEWQLTLLDLNVKGLDIIYYLTMLATLNNQIIDEHSNQNLESVAVWFGCASGENRTGIAYYHNICFSVIDYFEKNKQVACNTESRKSIFELIAKCQHIFLMTGNAGNTIGTEGIRDKSSGSFKNYHPKDKLVLKTSDVKALPVHDSCFNLELKKLGNVIESIEKNSIFKPILSLVEEIIQQIHSYRASIIFLSNEEKTILYDLLYALEKLMVRPNSEMGFNMLLQVRKSIDTYRAKQSKSLFDGIIALNVNIIKLIHAFQSTQKILLDTHLTKQGMFNGHDKQDPDSGNCNNELPKPCL
ncbi:MAG: hypothetical protein KIT56_07730, partial [Gammaproteobacteria bacterium]|nr:hypothetical protein [Gammaproteobacteria bacterium]